VAALIMSAMPACVSQRARDADNWQPLEPIVRAALAVEREAFVRGDAEAALRKSGLDTVHWPAVRVQTDAAVRRRKFALRQGLDYHAVLEARTTVDSARLTSYTATLWVTGLSVYALRMIDRDAAPGPSMREPLPHVFSFARQRGTWVLVRDSIISLAELHRHAPRRRPRDTPTQPFRTGDEIHADIARGPVPGFGGIIVEEGRTCVVLLTDTLTQKAAAEAFFRREAEAEIRSRSNYGNCARRFQLGFRQVRYDFAQLYDWYMGSFRKIPRKGVVLTTDIDEARNQLAIGVVDSSAQRATLRFVETLPIPKGVVRVEVIRCVGSMGDPSVMVEVRDPNGRAAALGTTIVIQDGAFKDSVDGSRAIGELHVGAGRGRPGRYEVRLYKPGYRPVVLRDVMAPADDQCLYAFPSDIRKVTLELLPDAPKVRSIVVSPPGVVLGRSDWEKRLRAIVDAEPGVSDAVRWTSSDTTVATISATGVLRSTCRATTGRAVITATSVADARIRGHASVTVVPPRSYAPTPMTREAAECLQRLRDMPRDSSR
jgi:hypothetical protein